MKLGGLQKTTLLDFPGRVACTVFTVGCNFRCPFCHNKDLVGEKEFEQSGREFLPEEEFFAFLETRKGILEGVCITGGEPLLQPDLEEFCREIKKNGFLVKLDTNGSFPQRLEGLIKRGLVDFVAMDIKTVLENYPQVARIPFSPAKIKATVKIILAAKIEYQFRTTVVPGLHNQKIIAKMARQLRKLGVKRKDWVLQNFRPQNCLDPSFLKITPFTTAEFEELKRKKG